MMSKEDKIIAKALRIAEDRVACYEAKEDHVNSPSAMRQWSALFFSTLDQSREHFVLVCLNSRNKVLSGQVIHSGTTDGCEVSPGVIVRHALKSETCVSVIIVHNHPSGYLEPSAADHAITQRLKQALALVDIRVLDHLIVHGSNSMSMAERGWL